MAAVQGDAGILGPVSSSFADASHWVQMIKLTEERQTVPYVWVHPDEDR
jgi:hypothetical protein